MEEETPTAQAGEPPYHNPNVSMNVAPHNRLWWGILAVYSLLVISTGYLAFVAKDTSPVLDMQGNALAARMADSATRELLIATLQQDAVEHKKKGDLAAQSFDVVLGSLLGFLSASAVSRITTRGEG